jgi:uncharacterized membrane protein
MEREIEGAMAANNAIQPHTSGTTEGRISASRRSSSPSSDSSLNQIEQLALVTLGGGLVTRGLQRRSLGGTVLALAGGALMYQVIKTNPQFAQAVGLRSAKQSGVPVDALEIRRSITIGASADELYHVWRAPETLPRIMQHVAAVTIIDTNRAHWVLHAPLGQTLEWDTQVVEDRPGEYVGWESLPGAQLASAGSIRFRSAPGGRGTEVTLDVRFDPPAGALGEAVMKFLSAVPKALVGKALRQFKSLAETGEIPTTKHQPAARNDGRDE